MSQYLKPTIEDFIAQGKKEILESVNFNKIEDYGKKWEEVFSLIFAHLPQVYKTSNALTWAKSYVERSITPSLVQLDLMILELQLFLDLGASAKRGLITLGLDKFVLEKQMTLMLESIAIKPEALRSILISIQTFLDYIDAMDVIDLGANLDKETVLGSILEDEYTPNVFSIDVSTDRKFIEIKISNEDVITILNNLKKEISFAKRYFKKGFETL